MATGWTTITTTFSKSDKPYGGGDFRIRGNQVLSMKLARPEITFKPASQSKDPDVAEPTEAWMNDSSERLNRSTVNFLRGTIEGGLKRTFQQRGQDAAWWYSKDWRTVYVSTGWMDYNTPDSPGSFTPQITKLWRSSDGGQTWTQLNWQEDRNIGQLLFLDSQRGYAVGWGPHVWRTADGGQSWHEVKVPPLANAGNPRKTFDGVNLSPDGVLRVAYYVEQLGEIKTSSLVYRINWSQSEFERDVVLPHQTVVDLQSSPDTTGRYSLYALSRLGAPRNWDDPNDKGHRTGALSAWTGELRTSVQQLHTFDDHLMFDGLSVGKEGVLLVYATDASGDGAPRDLTFLSKDSGKSWKELNDGAAQGGYFDPETNTQYALFAYTLKKRQL
ncbi:glycosyl hydrolase [Paraburkholderia dinghuensis]|uniref:Glycosyl hydrolase n=1 Tax=Paraburkholderia dinghuensis TaxID=2305225 RepID=A0A3N6MX94_9BURK|nr:glycosyl hydrolase [Paraburkholderia dinghuensis]RQH08644.1 glycosyl hydrolase [Paraburkholderia dinghuensis]